MNSKSKKQPMCDSDKAAIEALARAENYRGPEIGPAKEAYYRGLAYGDPDGDHMRFMSEVCSGSPDLGLRSTYRKRLLKALEQKDQSCHPPTSP